MKEEYNKPTIEIVDFEQQDVLTASEGSNPPWGGEETPFG